LSLAMPTGFPFRPLTGKEMVRWTILLTLACELITLLFRFGFGLEATRDTADTVGQITHGVRIHHAYLGLVLITVARGVVKRRPAIGSWGVVIGAALVLSDLIHHFLVLWPILGDPMFHWVYP